MIRCPKCKTVLAVESADPIPPPPPPATAKPAAPPLPFGRPAPAKPVAATPAMAAPVASAKAAPVRARLAPIQTDTIDEKTATSEAEAERLRQLRKALRKLEEQEERDAERYEEVVEECYYGRNAMIFLSGSMYCQGIGPIIGLVGLLAGITIGVPYLYYALYLAIALGGLSLLLNLAGFGTAVPGPKNARHIAIAGLVVTVGQIGLCAMQLAAAIKLGPPKDVSAWWEGIVVQNAFGIVTNLPLLSEHPARLLLNYPISLIAVLAAALEFTRLVLACMLAQYYAADGKAPDLGHQSMACVSRLFWVVLLSAMFRIAIASGFDWIQKEDVMSLIAKGVHGIIGVATLFLVALNLLWEGQVMRDVVEVTDPRRFAHEGGSLEL